MHKILVAAIFMVAITLTGCNDSIDDEEKLERIDLGEITNEGGEEGYILLKRENSILFAPTWQENLLEKYSDNELVYEYPDAVSVSLREAKIVGELKEAQRIKLWYSRIQESNPPTIIALKVKVLDDM